MLDLIRTDFRRAFKDKLLIALAIIGGFFAVTTPLLYKGLFLLLELDEIAMQEMEMLGLGMNAKSMFFSSFSLGNNFGLILPILVAIILCKDFSQGTIRNKIICGKSRASIYFSLLTTCAALICGLIMAHAFLTLGVSLVFFDYQATEFSAADFGYLMASLGIELLIFLMISALLVLFIVRMKNAGLAIVMFFVVSFAFMIIGSITQVVAMFSEPDTAIYEVLEVFNKANVFANMSIGTGTEYELDDILCIVIPNAVATAALVALGFASFRKKDLK